MPDKKGRTGQRICGEIGKKKWERGNMWQIEKIREFMQEFIIFAVVAAFCMHLLPEKKYQKYARFVIGLVYICMILSAAGEIMGKTVSEIHF